MQRTSVFKTDVVELPTGAAEYSSQILIAVHTCTLPAVHHSENGTCSVAKHGRKRQTRIIITNTILFGFRVGCQQLHLVVRRGIAAHFPQGEALFSASTDIYIISLCIQSGCHGLHSCSSSTSLSPRGTFGLSCCAFVSGYGC